jgi:putative oxidoreductase
MESGKALAMLIGRILLVYIFLVSGWGKIGNFAGTAQMMAQHGIPMAPFFLVGAVFFEFGGSLLVILGFLTRWGALLLLIFLVPTTLIFHGNVADPMQKIQFMKNVALFGGVLFLLGAGPGRLSVDRLRRKGGR